MSEQRKLKLLKVTELDLETKKVALPEQNFDYDDLIGEEYVEYYPINLGTGMMLIPTINEQDDVLHTSTVHRIGYIDGNLVVKTRNTAYFFEVIE